MIASKRWRSASHHALAAYVSLAVMISCIAMHLPCRALAEAEEHDGSEQMIWLCCIHVLLQTVYWRSSHQVFSVTELDTVTWPLYFWWISVGGCYATGTLPDGNPSKAVTNNGIRPLSWITENASKNGCLSNSIFKFLGLLAAARRGPPGVRGPQFENPWNRGGVGSNQRFSTNRGLCLALSQKRWKIGTYRPNMER